MSNVSDFEKMYNEALSNAPTYTGASFPKIDIEGSWAVKVIEASYGANQAGTGKRGLLKVEVIANLNGSEDRVTARTNLYLNTSKDSKMSAMNLKPWKETFEGLVGKEKLLEDVNDYDDLIQSIVSHANKLLKRGTDIVIGLQTRKQGKADDKGREQFYKNVFVYTPAVEEAKTDLVVSADPF